MNKHLFKSSLIALSLTLSACASVPNGPSSMALPGTGKSFNQFRSDDSYCRQFAQSQIGGTSANQLGNDSFARTAVLTTAIGAAVGAAAGGGSGAAVGAATGLVVGSAIGSNEAQLSSYEAQRYYDNAYTQCMYASGHKVPVSGRFVNNSRGNDYSPPAHAPSSYIPPPPPNRSSSTP